MVRIIVYILGRVGLTFYVDSGILHSGTDSLGHMDSKSGIRTEKPRKMIRHGPVKVIVVTVCTEEEAYGMVKSLLLVKVGRF